MVRSDWTPETVADFLEQRIAAADAQLDARITGLQQAVTASETALDKRLDGMNEFRAAMQDQAARTVTRTEFEGEVRAIQTQLEQQFAPVTKQLAEQGRPNWFLLISLLSVFIAMASGCWLMIGLQINVSVQPQILAIEQLKTDQAAFRRAMDLMQTTVRSVEQQGAVSVAADSESRLDRSKLNTEVLRLRQDLSNGTAARRAADERFTAALVEIETQFCESDALRNIMHANDLRMFAVLWSKVIPDAQLSTGNAYYPIVCNKSAVGHAASTDDPPN